MRKIRIKKADDVWWVMVPTSYWYMPKAIDHYYFNRWSDVIDFIATKPH